MKHFIILVTAILFSGCIANSNPHQVYIDVENLNIGKKWNPQPELLNPINKGKISANGVVRNGYGLTHISKGENGTLIYHIFEYEYLNGLLSFPFFTEDKSYIGKCLIYYVVDPKTGIIIDWGFDEGGNPKCCRVTG
jgi:hypothetical protein